MSPVPGTLVLDDGELDDVRSLLDELGIAYTYLRGSAVEGVDVGLPDDLLVTTARRALALQERLGTTSHPGDAGPVRMVVVSEDSNTLRSMLRNVGYDFLIRRPVHRAALRLLVLRALYHGPERRSAQRVPVGAEVAYRTGFRKHPATLLEIALRGCRLETAKPIEPDTRLTVLLPKHLTGDRSLGLRGWVVRCERSPGRQPRAVTHEVAVAFEALSSSVDRGLREVLKRGTGDDREVLPAPPTEETPVPAGAPEVVDADVDERRLGRRASYTRRVMALKDEARRALVGRNLSTGGMLVEQNLDIGEGDEVTVAIFGRDREEPVLLRARAVRDDAQGVALRFLDVDPDQAARLERLVATLPSVERLADSEAEAMGTVVAELVEEG